jgi:hypothetical protein
MAVRLVGVTLHRSALNIVTWTDFMFFKPQDESKQSECKQSESKDGEVSVGVILK